MQLLYFILNTYNVGSLEHNFNFTYRYLRILREIFCKNMSSLIVSLYCTCTIVQSRWKWLFSGWVAGSGTAGRQLTRSRSRTGSVCSLFWRHLFHIPYFVSWISSTYLFQLNSATSQDLVHSVRLIFLSTWFSWFIFQCFI